MRDFNLLIFSSFVLFSFAQEPSENGIHPWQTECAQYGCYIGSFCNYTSNLCEACPLDTTVCSVGDNETQANCENSCARAQQGDACSANHPCKEGHFFCDYAQGEFVTCQACKENVEDCLNDPFLTSELGMEDCIQCDLPCVPLHFSSTLVENETIASNALLGSPLSNNTRGKLVDCTNLIHREETVCEGAAGKVCLVEDFSLNTYYVDVVNKCANSGGMAVILFGDFTPRTPNDTPWQGSLSFKETPIPSVSISYDDGIRLRESKLNKTANVSVYSVGDYCQKRQFCSETVPCIGSSAEMYCDFKYIDVGVCRDCPVDDDGNDDPLACFFSKGDIGRVQGQDAVESCAQKCASSLEFGNCKLCPQDINGFEFGVDPGEEQCNFCPENDVLYPQQPFPLFGDDVECWQVQKFFKNVQVHPSAPNCQLAQMMNYVCGCEGPGYGGASTETKRVVLAWLPRVMAILSILGSSFVVFDASRSKKKRQKLLNQLLISLSLFDIVGSCAFALTTLPIPEEDLIPVYGAKGTEATCTAQGFFIQMGTISCYTNVSLAVYYLLAIKFGQRERELKTKRVWLVVCPVTVGLAFAFAGIPFYGNMITWCSNTASWWPDIPVVFAIFSATVIMGVLCWDVYKKESASARWRGGGAAGGERARNTLSEQVFWQSFFYLMAFYLTWPAYLALQYSWAADNYFANYGLVLAAATMVPLQGFWNFIVYIRPRQYKTASASVRRVSTAILARLQSQRDTSFSNSSCATGFFGRFRMSSRNTASTPKSEETSASRYIPSSREEKSAPVNADEATNGRSEETNNVMDEETGINSDNRNASDGNPAGGEPEVASEG